MDYQQFRKLNLNKYFINPGLYLIGVPNSQTHKAQKDMCVTRSGSKSAMKLSSGMSLYKLGLASDVSNRLSDYMTALPKSFKVYVIVEKQAGMVRLHEKKIHEWLGDLGLRYNRFGESGSSVSRTEWGGASLAKFKAKLTDDHLSSASRACPFIWFSANDAVFLNGTYKDKSLLKLIEDGTIRPRVKKARF